MKELTRDEVRGLGHAVGLDIQDPGGVPNLDVMVLYPQSELVTIDE